MVQRCHRWRQKRKLLLDQARAMADDIERERALQAVEHYGRIVNEEQAKIDSKRGPKQETEPVSAEEYADEDFQDFKNYA
jgi:hypothetical protein